ncbi:MAG: DUF192 domain-containing protein [bacterium]
MKLKITNIFLSILLILFVIFLFDNKYYNKEKQSDIKIEKYETICGKYAKCEIKINNKILLADIADDNCKRKLGLSGKKSIEEGAMFFVFEKMGNYGFWMKDINFPIDILWINDNFEIIGIEKNILSNTYPKIFGEIYLTKYVLEVPAFYSDKNNIKIGDKIEFL